MMTYSFYIEDNTLVCEENNNGDIYVIYDEEAIEKLYNYSNFKYKEVKIENDEVIFMGKRYRIIIKDCDKVLNMVGGPGCAEMLRTIKKENRLNQFKKAASKRTIASELGIVIATCSISLLAVLKEANDATYIPPKEIIQIEVDEPDDDFNIVEVDETGNAKFLSNAVLKTTPLAIEKTDLNELSDEVDNIIKLETKNIESEEQKESFDKLIYQPSNLSADIVIECEERGYSDDVQNVVEKYGAYIADASLTYGISANLLTAMLTQESHGKVEDNVMQILFKPNQDEVRKVYNFKECKWEKFVLTNNPRKYGNDVIIYSEASIKDPYSNIMYAAGTLSYYFNQYFKGNIFAAVNAYNKGPNAQKEILKRASEEYELTVDDLLRDPHKVNVWIEFDDNEGITKDDSKYIAGDPYYIEHVFQYATNADTDGVYIKRMNENGTVTKVSAHIYKKMPELINVAKK